MVTAIYECVVKHVRTEPFRYALRQRTFSWFVDLDDPPRLRWWLRPLARFETRERIDGVLAANGLSASRVTMLAHAKALGYAFNPLTVYWCHRADGSLVCVVAEVHNTYGQRHSYLFRAPAGDAVKELYVSPFNEVAGGYRVSLAEPSERVRLAIRYGRFVATATGRRREPTPLRIVRAAASGWLVPVAIRWHGIRLFLRGLPVVPRPSALRSSVPEGKR
jgi:DUF1365 family protein